jgi:hypothetical protein
MMRLVNHSATAAHWSRAQYDRVLAELRDGWRL